MTDPVKVGPFGGSGGVVWDDYVDNPNIDKLVGFVISGRNVIYSIQGLYKLTSGQEVIGNRHGGGADNTNSVTFQPNWKVVNIGVRSGARLDSIIFIVSDGANIFKLGPYGGSGGSYTSHTVDQLVAFFGRSGSQMDAMGWYAGVSVQGEEEMTVEQILEKARSTAK